MAIPSNINISKRYERYEKEKFVECLLSNASRNIINIFDDNTLTKRDKFDRFMITILTSCLFYKIEDYKKDFWDNYNHTIHVIANKDDQRNREFILALSNAKNLGLDVIVNYIYTENLENFASYALDMANNLEIGPSIALENKNITVLRAMKEAGINVWKNNYWDTVQRLAIKHRDNEFFTKLVEAKVSIWHPDYSEYWNKALMHAVKNKDSDFVSKLIEDNKDNIDWQKTFEKTLEIALISAFQNEDNKTFIILLNKMKEIVSSIIPEIKEDNKKDGNLSNEKLDESILVNEKFKFLIEDEFEKKIEKIDSDIKNKINEIREKLQVLYKQYEKKQQILKEQKILYANEAIKTFYITIQALFEAKLISMLLLQGDLLQRSGTKKETAAEITGGVTVGWLGWFPVVGGIANTTNIGIGKAVVKTVDHERAKQAKKIQYNVLNISNVSELCELIARKIAQKYEELIKFQKFKSEECHEAGKKVVDWMYEDLINGKIIFRGSTKKEYIQAFIDIVENKHQKGKLFKLTSKKTEAHPSKALKTRIAEVSDNQRVLSEKIEFLEKGNKKFKINSFEP